MKYFVISDVHSYYYEMIDALNKAGFDPLNENHTLISLGDITDRGVWPNEVINYLMSLDRKILIRGNHEDLLEELLTYSRMPNKIDYRNGTFRTIKYLAETIENKSYTDEYTLDNWQTIVESAKKTKVLEYLDSCINYYKTKEYVFIHGWVPTRFNTITKRFEAILNFDDVMPYEWGDSRWTNGLQMTIDKVFYPSKTIVCGHWHASSWHDHFKGKDFDTNNEPYISKNVIAIDACTVLSGFVNCLVLDDDN